jgi:DNA replication protein DnaC
MEQTKEIFEKTYAHNFRDCFDPFMRYSLKSDPTALIEYIDKKKSVILKRYNNCLWDLGFTPNIKMSIRSWLNNPEKWLYMHGNIGCGKTTLMSALYLELLKKGIDVCIFNVRQLEYEIKDGIETNSERKILKQARNTAILMLDDLGVETLSEYNLGWIYNLIDERQSDFRSTIISSNLNMNDLREHYSKVNGIFAKRIVSRIKQNSFEIEFDNVPYR